MKRIIGICMIASVLLLMFAAHAVQMGIAGALLAWGITFAVIAFIVAGVWLII